MAHQKMPVVVNSGDGDCYGEGGNHFLHAIRRNMDLTLLVHNNQIYGLTKGQASPTSDKGMVTKVQKDGVLSAPVRPLALALTQGAGFVARSFSGNRQQLTELIQQGMAYPGLALIDILQPCISFNRINTFAWYKQRIYDVAETGHDTGDRTAALQLAMAWEEHIATGLLFRDEQAQSFEQQHPVLAADKEGSLRQRNAGRAALEKRL